MSQSTKFKGVETSVIKVNGELHGIYHRTTVCLLKTNGKVELRTGGWQTNTTKLRMNQFSNTFCNGRFSVFQHKGEWFVQCEGVEIPFVEGMEI